MAVATETARFRQGAGRPCLDFIRTLRHRGTAEATEELVDPAALAAWTRQFSPDGVEPPEPPGVRQLTEARELREAIYELLTAAGGAAGAASCRAAARDRINRAASFPVPAPNPHAP